MGPYCRYCTRRCFLPRVLRNGKSMILASCVEGMDNDLAKLGQNVLTAVNPTTNPEGVERIIAAPEFIGPEEFCTYCLCHTNAHTYTPGSSTVICVGCRGKVCVRAQCQTCTLPLVAVDGAWVVVGTQTTADGLSYCPPDPDAPDTTQHRPVTPAARSGFAEMATADPIPCTDMGNGMLPYTAVVVQPPLVCDGRLHGMTLGLTYCLDKRDHPAHPV